PLTTALGRFMYFSEHLPGFRRSIGISASILLTPVLVSLALLSLHAGLYILVAWKVVVFPHDWYVIREAYGSKAVFPAPWAAVAAIVQWLTVVVMVAWFTKSMKPRNQFLLSLITILIIGIAVSILAKALGFHIEADLL
ncbi:MAG TPA: hypothetical protein DCS87_03400, partial [Rheinheimera sp.]|nr:hypothetical protein [Rheinheimera sp.]